MRLNVLAVSLLLAIVTSPLAAQRPTANAVQLAPGTRVRVKAPTLVSPLVANFLEQRGDTLVFIEDGTGRGVWTFTLSQIERLETTAGEGGRNKRPIARAATIGGGVGLIAGVLFASSASPSDTSRQYSRPLTGLVGAALGAGVGAIIGSRVKSEQWSPVPLPRQLTLIPSRRGLSIVLTLP